MWAPARSRLGRRVEAAPWWLTVIVAIVGVGLITPLVGVVHQAFGASSSTVRRVLTGPLLPTLLTHTIYLTAVVSVACGLLGLGAARLVERTDLPLRRVFAVVLLLPSPCPSTSPDTRGWPCRPRSRGCPVRRS